MVNVGMKGMRSLGKDPVYDASVRAKIKGSASDKRKRGQQLRRLKEMSPEKLQEKGLEMLNSPQCFDMEMMQLIVELLKTEGLSDKAKMELVGKMTQVKTAIWGSKAVNLNMNMNTEVDSAKSMADIYEETKSDKVVIIDNGE